MSGHSKWSKVRHQKGVTDAAKGKIFTKLANAITLAVKEAGGLADPEHNFRLRLAIEKARGFNMPKENIERAIERGKGIGEEGNLEQVTYEAFGPKGVGIIIETATDNRQRTVSEIKNILQQGGGVLAASGAVSHLFELVGVVFVEKKEKSFDQIMEAALNSGAIDLEDQGTTIEIYTEPNKLHQVKEALERSGLLVSSFELDYRPKVILPIDNSTDASHILKLLSSLEEIAEVQKVSANFDIPDEFLPPQKN